MLSRSKIDGWVGRIKACLNASLLVDNDRNACAVHSDCFLLGRLSQGTSAKVFDGEH